MIGYIDYLPLVTSSQNIHEIIWDVDEIAGEKIEGRYFSTLGYPVKFTNALGYFSWPLKDGLYIFFDGIENLGNECRLLAEEKLKEVMGFTGNIQVDMTIVRNLNSTILKVRIDNNIPIKQSLQKVRIIKRNYGVEDKRFGYPYKSDMFVIDLDTIITPWLQEEGDIRKKHREEMKKRKVVV